MTVFEHIAGGIAGTAMMLMTALAFADAYDDGLELVRSGDIDRIEQTFSQQYEAFAEGRLDAEELVAAYDSLYTLDPEILDTIEAWRTAYPDSAAARVAAAHPKRHLAYLLRGTDVIRLVPRESLNRAMKLNSEAATLYAEALDLAPRHVAAANGLLNVAQAIGDRDAETRAARSIAAYGSEVALLIDQLWASSPQYGGSEGMMRELCRTVAPKIKDFSPEECHARATLILRDSTTEERARAVEVLRGNLDRHRFVVAREYLYSGRAQEGLDLYDEVGARVPGSLAEPFGDALQSFAVQERIVDKHLMANPLNPRNLAVKAEAQAARKDHEGAAKSLEKAMIYGETMPEVRAQRVRLFSYYEPRLHDFLAEAEDALGDTDLSPFVMLEVLPKAAFNAEPIRYDETGAEHDRFECRRARLLSAAIPSCSMHPNPRATAMCAPGVIQHIFGMLEDVDLDACADLGPLTPNIEGIQDRP